MPGEHGNMNNKAQLFTLDLLLALIPLTLVLGMSANAISGIASQSQEYVSTYSYHRQANDFMDIIVKTPGVPPDWDRTLNVTVNGAATYLDNGETVSNYINARKIYNLNETLIEEVLNTTDYNISLYIEDTSIFEDFTNFTFPTYGSPVPITANEMVAVERLVISDNLLQISQDYPEGVTDIGNIDGGRYSECTDTTLSLTQTEVDNFVFWFYLSFNCTNKDSCPSAMILGMNDGCNGAGNKTCNKLIQTNDVAIRDTPGSFYYCPPDGTNCTTIKEKDDCIGVNRSVEYWINRTTYNPSVYDIYIKVPTAFLRVGRQSVYIDIRGVESMANGWVALTPAEITREGLLAYFADVEKFKDLNSKLVLRMWR